MKLIRSISDLLSTFRDAMDRWRYARQSFTIQDQWQALLGRLPESETDRTRLRKRIGLIGGPILAVIALGAWLVFRPVPQPDYLFDDMDDVFNYTLLTDEFNRLPIEERLELISLLTQRLSNMTSHDSVLVAAFAAGVIGSAREQLLENFSRLLIDSWDMYAIGYADIPNEDRAAYIEMVAIEFMKLGETMEGRISDKTDDERLAEAKRQARRDQENLSNRNTRPSADQMSRIFTFMRSDIGQFQTPQQRARGTQMFRDLVRHMRKQDIATGKRGG